MASVFGQSSDSTSIDARKAASDQAQFADGGALIFVGGGSKTPASEFATTSKFEWATAVLAFAVGAALYAIFKRK